MYKAVLPNLVILTTYVWVDRLCVTLIYLFDHETLIVYILK